jgi:FKBP-type peptidyl-prolyl cis-trans isomerase FkpA
MLTNKILMSLLIFIAILASGCNKPEEVISWEKQFELDQQTIEKYLDDKDIAAIKHQSGLYYEVIEEGDGPVPVGESKITVNYTVYSLPNDIQLETNDNIPFFLNQLYHGWQIGLPLISEGGKIMLFLPRIYTDGKSVMRFYIELVKVE